MGQYLYILSVRKTTYPELFCFLFDVLFEIAYSQNPIVLQSVRVLKASFFCIFSSCFYTLIVKISLDAGLWSTKQNKSQYLSTKNKKKQLDNNGCVFVEFHSKQKKKKNHKNYSLNVKC